MYTEVAEIVNKATVDMHRSCGDMKKYCLHVYRSCGESQHDHSRYAPKLRRYEKMFFTHEKKHFARILIVAEM